MSFGLDFMGHTHELLLQEVYRCHQIICKACVCAWESDQFSVAYAYHLIHKRVSVASLPCPSLSKLRAALDYEPLESQTMTPSLNLQGHPAGVICAESVNEHLLH